MTTLAGLNPLDADLIRRYAQRNELTEEEAVSAFLTVAANDYQNDPFFTRKLDDHAAVVKINRPSTEPYPEPRSRW